MADPGDLPGRRRRLAPAEELRRLRHDLALGLGTGAVVGLVLGAVVVLPVALGIRRLLHLITRSWTEAPIPAERRRGPGAYVLGLLRPADRAGAPLVGALLVVTLLWADGDGRNIPSDLAERSGPPRLPPRASARTSEG